MHSGGNKCNQLYFTTFLNIVHSAQWMASLSGPGWARRGNSAVILIRWGLELISFHFVQTCCKLEDLCPFQYGKVPCFLENFNCNFNKEGTQGCHLNIDLTISEKVLEKKIVTDERLQYAWPFWHACSEQKEGTKECLKILHVNYCTHRKSFSHWAWLLRVSDNSIIDFMFLSINPLTTQPETSFKSQHRLTNLLWIDFYCCLCWGFKASCTTRSVHIMQSSLLEHLYMQHHYMYACIICGSKQSGGSSYQQPQLGPHPPLRHKKWPTHHSHIAHPMTRLTDNIDEVCTGIKIKLAWCIDHVEVRMACDSDYL